jgi:hypothetical protein
VNVDGATRFLRDIIPANTNMDCNRGRKQAFWVPYLYFGI